MEQYVEDRNEEVKEAKLYVKFLISYIFWRRIGGWGDIGMCT